MEKDHSKRGGRARARRAIATAATAAAISAATPDLACAEAVATPTPLPHRLLVVVLHPLRRVDGLLSLDLGRTVGQARFTPVLATAAVVASVAAGTTGEAEPSPTPTRTADPGMDVRVELTAPLEAPADAAGAPVAVDPERRLQVVAGSCGAALRGARGGLEELGDFTSPTDGRAGLQAHSNLGYAQLRGRSLLVVRPQGGGFPDEVLLACGEIGPE